MKPPAAVAKASYVSILGALGSGAAGDVSHNTISQFNAAPIGPAATVEWDSSPFVSRTGRVLITGTISVSPGTLADGDPVLAQIFRDGTTAVSGTSEVAAGTAGASVKAFAVCTFTDTVTPGSSHTWGIRASIGNAHTGQIVIGDATIVVTDIGAP